MYTQSGVHTQDGRAVRGRPQFSSSQSQGAVRCPACQGSRRMTFWKHSSVAELKQRLDVLKALRPKQEERLGELRAHEKRVRQAVEAYVAYVSTGTGRPPVVPDDMLLPPAPSKPKTPPRK